MSDKKQLFLFLMICLPAGWILSILAYHFGANEGSASGSCVSFLMAFTPAVAAIISKKCAGKSVRELMLLPRLDTHVPVYALAILLGVGMSLWTEPLVGALFFPEVSVWNEGITGAQAAAQLLLSIAVAGVSFFVLMGEEIGWMGFLYPQLEKLCGEIPAVLLTGIIRTLWHLGMLIYMENFWQAVVSLLLSNVCFGVFLVMLTKKSGSVIPASICHCFTNSLPGVISGWFVLDEVVYEHYAVAIEAISYLPFVIGFVVLLLRKPAGEGEKR